MKVFVSYSFNTDEIVANSLNKIIEREGHEPFEHDALTRKLRYVYAGGDDLLDLDIAFRRAGYRSSTQERSDPMMFEHLINTIAGQDVLVILWSQDYANKFWTRIEWKTALAMCKPLIVIQMDKTSLARDLERAVCNGAIPKVEFNQDFRPTKVISLLNLFHNPHIAECFGEKWDKLTETFFVRLKHPFLGYFEIGKFEVINQKASNSSIPIHMWY